MKFRSNDIAKHFDLKHTELLKVIESPDMQYMSEEFKKNFKEVSFSTEKGREYKEYELTRSGLFYVIMSLKTRKATPAKMAILKAFNSMESELLKTIGSEVGYKSVTNQRRFVNPFTNTVKDFIAYATTQGSTSAEHYYSNLTKMEYAALSLIEWGSKVPSNFRDSLDLMDLSFLTAAEAVARQWIQHGMDNSMHYKDVFQLAKEKVQAYADTIKSPRITVQKDSQK